MSKELATTTTATATTTLPDCITELTIENILAKLHKSDDLKLVSCFAKRINQTGDNFCSDIYTVQVKYTKTIAGKPCEEAAEYILKVLMPELAEIGSNEVLMFEEILPAMTRIFKRAKTGLSDIKMSADCLYTDRSGKEIYLLENLNVLGYKIEDRTVGLNEAQARIVLEKIAKFHAVGMILQEENPELVAKLSPSHFVKGEEDPIAKIILIDGTEYAAQVVSTWPGYESIGQKMLKKLPQNVECMKKLVDPKNSKYNVLIHGDLWMNNVLFKYAEDGGNSKNPSDVIFVDFQNCFLGSVGIDLSFFFYTSLQLDVLKNKQDELLRHYYDCFAAALKAYDYSRLLPSYDLLLAELERCEFYKYYSAVCEMPLCSMDKRTSEGFNALTFGDPAAMKIKREMLYSNERVQTLLRYVLPQFEKHGLLELTKEE